MPITTKVVSSNPAHGEVYSIQLYVIKFVSDLINSFLRFPPYRLYITEILFKVALNTITIANYISLLISKIGYGCK